MRSESGETPGSWRGKSHRLPYDIAPMDTAEALFLARAQFGLNIGFHILFPSLTIALGCWLHVFSAAMVAVGTTISAFWILALNSWMQTPAGHAMDGSQIIAGDWLQVIFNPSFPYRFTHMLLASGLTASFVVAGLSAWRLLRAGEDASARNTLRTGLVLA